MRVHAKGGSFAERSGKKIGIEFDAQSPETGSENSEYLPPAFFAYLVRLVGTGSRRDDNHPFGHFGKLPYDRLMGERRRIERSAVENDGDLFGGRFE
jgi:hypothetical protein